MFPDSGSEPDFEGFHVSELAGDLSGEDDSGSEVVTDSDDDDDDGVMGRLSNAAAAAAYRTNPNLPDFIHPHGPFWSRYAIIPLAGLIRRFTGHWRPWACHATNHKIFIY